MNKREYSLLYRLFSDTLIRNSVYLMTTSLSTVGLGFFFWVIAARVYPPEEVGEASALISSMYLLSMLANLGFNISMIRFLPTNRSDSSRIISSCITLSLIAAVVLSLVFLAGRMFWAPSLRSLDRLESMLFFIGVTLLVTVSALLTSTFVAGKKSSFHLVKETLMSVVKIPLLFVFTGLGTLGIFTSWGIAVLFAVVIGFWLSSLLWKYKFGLGVDPVIRSMLLFSAGNYIAQVMFAAPRLVLPLLIANSISPSDAAYLYIAMTAGGLLYAVPQAISTSFLAEASGGGDVRAKTVRSARFTLALVLPGSIVFILGAKYILWLFNPMYAENATTAMILFVLTALPLSVNSIFTAFRNVEKKVASVIKINTSTALGSLGGAYLLLDMGINGAALAFLAANTMVAAVLLLRTKKPLKILR